MGTPKKPAQAPKKKMGRPPSDKALDATIKLRLSAEDKALYGEAATRVAERRGGGTASLSAWIRETLTAAARAEVKRKR
jgi:hypothetical protein